MKKVSINNISKIFIILSGYVSTLNAAVLFNNRLAWELGVNQAIFVEKFDTDIPAADMLVFNDGTIALGENPIGNTTNDVLSGLWRTQLYNVGGSNGYSKIIIDLPNPVTTFGIDINSISSSRGVKISGNWDGGGVQITDLWSHFGNFSNGFFGVIGSQPFNQVIIQAQGGSVVGSDFITADNLSYEDVDLIFINDFE